MFKKISITFFFIFFTYGLFADSVYLNDFKEADNNTARINILERALVDNGLNEFGWELYNTAFYYVLENFHDTDDYDDFRRMIMISLNALNKIAMLDDNKIGDLRYLWLVFYEYPDPVIKAEILLTLKNLETDKQLFILIISNYLVEMDQLFALGHNADYVTISASITALMELDDASSYPILLDIYSAGYPEVISSEALGAMEVIRGDLFGFLRGVIENETSRNKFGALRAGINSKNLSIAQRGELAELALRITLDEERKEDKHFSDLRYTAVSYLTSIRWTRANDLAVRHYYGTFAEYQENSAYRYRLIEAIEFLGAVGNSQAALALGLRLGLLNSAMERTGSFDAGITLAIIRALGLIGDNAAYNDLLRASTLSYNENITTAAREAMNRLKW